MIRQTFENWYSNGGKFSRAIERNGDGYKLKHAHDAWTSWQIASAATAGKCAEIAEPCGKGGMMSNVGPAIAAAIRREFNLSN